VSGRPTARPPTDPFRFLRRDRKIIGRRSGIVESADVRGVWSLRQEIALAYIDPTGRGLEIGPAFQPLAPKAMGFDVTILDHAPTDAIRAKYAALGLDQPRVDLIEDVDAVWTGGSYDVPGLNPPYDWIVAAHVIEHTPDPIGFMLDLSGLLAPGGRLVLVIPDKDFTYDHHRPLSTPGQMLDAHLNPSDWATPGMVLDHFAFHVTRGSEIAWHRESAPAEFRSTYTLEHAVAETKSVIDGAALDIHRWVFNPENFRFAFDALEEWLGGLRVVGSHPTAGCEFFVTVGN